MIKKGAKFVLVLIMFLGISFSILTFLSIELSTIEKTFVNNGHYERLGGSTLEDCIAPGTECECSVNMLPRV